MDGNVYSRIDCEQIVPRSLGVLGTATETSVDSEADHFDICKVRIGSKVYHSAVELLTNVMSNAPQRIADASQKCMSI